METIVDGLLMPILFKFPRPYILAARWLRLRRMFGAYKSLLCVSPLVLT